MERELRGAGLSRLSVDTESSFLGVVFRGQSLQTRNTGVLTHAGASDVVRRVPLTGKAHGSRGRGWRAAVAGQPFGQQRAMWRAPQAACSQPSVRTEI